ncbi:MFS transporter [Methylobacterium oryzae CBMB20]
MSDAVAAADHERAIMRKVILRIVPFLMICYFFNLLDRSNIGVASLQMRPHLGLSAAAYGFGGSLFFIGYFLFEVPSNLMLQRYGARRWIARIMVSWGLMCVLMATTQGPLSFYVLRFLLGVAEAGFFPGIVLFTTYWFPTRYRARIVAAFAMSIPLASFIGSPLSAGLLLADGFLGLHGWQWVFVAEGIPTILLGLACLVMLRDKPTDASWLSAEERSWLTRTIEAEKSSRHGAGHASLKRLVMNPQVWGLALACSASSAASASLSVWQPQLLKSFGLTTFQTGLVNAIPYGIAAALMLFWGAHSDRTGERRWHTALPLIVIALGFRRHLPRPFVIAAHRRAAQLRAGELFVLQGAILGVHLDDAVACGCGGGHRRHQRRLESDRWRCGVARRPDPGCYRKFRDRAATDGRSCPGGGARRHPDGAAPQPDARDRLVRPPLSLLRPYSGKP